MDRPRTAHRRRDAANSITVVELIRRQNGNDDRGDDRADHVPAGAAPIPEPMSRQITGPMFQWVGERIPQQRLAELLGPAEVDQPPTRPSRTARAAKLIGLFVGVLALCASLVVAATLAQHRQRPALVVIPATVPTEVTGVDALRPDALAKALGERIPSQSPVSTAPSAASATPRSTTSPRPYNDNDGGNNGTSAVAAPPSAPVRSASGSPSISASPSTAPTQPASEAAQQVVRSFFQLVTTSPNSALALLDPSMLGAGRDGFIRSWSGVSQVTVQSVRATTAGTVQAVISMRLLDGTLMRVVELLDLTSGNPPLINGAALLSAQRV